MQSMRTKLQVVFVRRISLIAVAFSFAFMVGCSRCEECDYQGSSETICETEFDSPDQYEDAISDREGQGASCTSTGGF
jgi:hypothetical protein